MDIVLFGFEPFLEYKENPSQLIVESLNGTVIGGASVRGITLPVIFSKVEEAIISALQNERPQLAIGIGVAGGRNMITPEKIAINYKNSKEPDMSGMIARGERIDHSEPDGIFSNLPVEGLVEELNRKKIPASLSLSAGGYLCNNAMFVIIREAKRNGYAGGFIHIPFHSEYVMQTKKDFASMPLNTLRSGIEVSIEYLMERLHSE